MTEQEHGYVAMGDSVETVARAIHFRGGKQDDDAWDHCPPYIREIARQQARAALAALSRPAQEPTANRTRRTIERSDLSPSSRGARPMNDTLKLWFFRDLSDDQRLKLFGLFGLPVDEIGKVHGRQTIALQHIVRKLVDLVREETSAPAPAKNVLGRPAGHCDDDEAWQKFSTDYAHHPRANLGKGAMTDFALANAQFMCDRNSLDLIVYQTAVKERIRWLSIQLAAALAAKTPSPDCIEDAAKHVFNAMRVAAKEAGVNAPAWTDRGNSTMQEEARSAAYRILNTPASALKRPHSMHTQERDLMRKALEQIAGPRDCGCSPVCQCNSQESLEVEVDALRDIALAALSSTPVNMNDEGKSKTQSPAPNLRGS